jgi:hypothetical protein
VWFIVVVVVVVVDPNVDVTAEEVEGNDDFDVILSRFWHTSNELALEYPSFLLLTFD